jgi:1-acyl-sn-glycerol-3-phosphate acyltransferase
VTESAFKAPLFGDYLRKAGHVPVIVGRGHEAFDAGKRLLEEGHVIAIFPEGALSPEGRVARPHTGVTRLALSTGAPVIPVGIALDSAHIRLWDTGIKGTDGSTEVAKVYAGGPYYITMGVPMRITGDIEDRKLVASHTQRIMRHIVRLSKMSEFRIQGAELPKEAVETTIAGAIQIPFEIPS